MTCARSLRQPGPLPVLGAAWSRLWRCHATPDGTVMPHCEQKRLGISQLYLTSSAALIGPLDHLPVLARFLASQAPYSASQALTTPSLTPQVANSDCDGICDGLALDLRWPVPESRFCQCTYRPGHRAGTSRNGY